MARPIEATPILDDEEWSAFLNRFQQTKRTPLRVHTVNVEEMRKLVKQNKEDLDFFRSQNDYIADTIRHTTFADGMDNDVTVIIKSFMRRNCVVAYHWLHEFFMSHQSDPVIMAGLLRSLSMIPEREAENIMLDMVKTGLAFEDSSVQEAAIMVIEEWRTEKCLDAVRQIKRFASDWVKKYAYLVVHELEEELSSCTC